MGKREEEFLREGDFFLKKEIPLSRSPSLKNLLGGEIGDWRIQLLRLFRGGKGTKRCVVGARLLEARFSRGVMNPALFSFPFAGCAALAGLIGVLQVFWEIVL